jgi:hypothetical protein
MNNSAIGSSFESFLEDEDIKGDKEGSINYGEKNQIGTCVVIKICYAPYPAKKLNASLSELTR